MFPICDSPKFRALRGFRELLGQAARRHVGLLMGHIVPCRLDALRTEGDHGVGPVLNMR